MRIYHASCAFLAYSIVMSWSVSPWSGETLFRSGLKSLRPSWQLLATKRHLSHSNFHYPKQCFVKFGSTYFVNFSRRHKQKYDTGIECVNILSASRWQFPIMTISSCGASYSKGVSSLITVTQTHSRSSGLLWVHSNRDLNHGRMQNITRYPIGILPPMTQTCNF
jgi:hypothetical protein